MEKPTEDNLIDWVYVDVEDGDMPGFHKATVTSRFSKRTGMGQARKVNRAMAYALRDLAEQIIKQSFEEGDFT